MINLRQGSIATERNGVHENLVNNILANYFFSAEIIEKAQKEFFLMNDYVTTNEMNLFCSTNGK